MERTGDAAMIPAGVVDSERATLRKGEKLLAFSIPNRSLPSRVPSLYIVEIEAP
jgi:hypothetical protein